MPISVEMDAIFETIARDCHLSVDAEQQLLEVGFIVVPGAVPLDKVGLLAEAYEASVASAAPEDVSIGRATIRVHDFVNRGSEFDELYLFPPLLKACCRVIGQPFKLSNLLARTLRPDSPAQEIHVDFRRDVEGFPMVGFIMMIDEFRSDNGATRFVPGSHAWRKTPEDSLRDRNADHADQVLASGPAGSTIIYNGSVWHGHTANRSDKPRRSIQGAYIRRQAQSGIDFPARTTAETRARISPLAKYLINV